MYNFSNCQGNSESKVNRGCGACGDRKNYDSYGGCSNSSTYAEPYGYGSYYAATDQCGCNISEDQCGCGSSNSGSGSSCGCGSSNSGSGSSCGCGSNNSGSGSSCSCGSSNSGSGNSCSCGSSNSGSGSSCGCGSNNSGSGNSCGCGSSNSGSGSSCGCGSSNSGSCGIYEKPSSYDYSGSQCDCGTGFEDYGCNSKSNQDCGCGTGQDDYRIRNHSDSPREFSGYDRDFGFKKHESCDERKTVERKTFPTADFEYGRAANGYKHDKHKKCKVHKKKKGNLCECDHAIELIREALCRIQKGVEEVRKGLKEICQNNYNQGQECMSEGIRAILIGLCDLIKTLECIRPYVCCEDWKLIHQGICHIEKGLDDICKAQKELTCYCDECSIRKVEEGICDIDEGLRKINKGLSSIL